MYQNRYIPVLESSSILKVRSMLINLSPLRFIFYFGDLLNLIHDTDLLHKLNVSSVAIFTKYSHCEPSSKCGEPTSARLEGYRVMIG